MNNIKVGDIVKVKNWGRCYTTNTPWFIKNFTNIVIVDPECIINYAYDDNEMYKKYYIMNSDPNEYRVLYISDGLALITDECFLRKFDGSIRKAVYLISFDGLKKIKKMTKAEIERELGYEIEIIGERENDEC